jgi:hypothetical protein
LTGRSSPAATSTAAATANAAGSCSDLYFISARGSGEASTGTSDESASAETDATYKAVEQQLKAQGVNPSTTFYQLPYPAPSINELLSGLQKPTSTSTIGLTVESDWIRLMDVNLPKYIAGEEQGESGLYAYLAEVYHTCNSVGQQPMVVLAGFSQGAMVIHNVLNEIAANKQTNFMSMIKGAVLIADPERMPSSDVINFGTAEWSDYGICHALDILPIYHSHITASCVPPGITTDVASYFSSVAYQVCDTDDLVCDTSGLFKLKRDVPSFTNVLAFMTDVRLGSQTHTLSYTSGEMRTAGRRVARSLILDGLGSQPSPSPTPTPSLSPTPSPSTSAPSGSGSWTVAEAPLPADAASNTSVDLYGLACGSADSCVAVGYESVRNVPGWNALIETMNGGTWTAAEAPVPSQLSQIGVYSSNLNSVTCTSATSCTAVGQYEDQKQNIGALIETLNGTTWTAAIAPLPTGGSGGYLGSISCASSSFCVAAGSYQNSSGDPAGLIETLNDGTWTGIEAPAAGGGSPSLSSVSCGAAGFCAAVGTYLDTIGVIETLSDGTWTAVSEPLPANATSNPVDGQGFDLVSVACPSASSCVAAGSYLSNQGSDQGVIEALSDGTWTATEAPLPADADPTKTAGSGSVTCSSAQSCLVLGGYNEDNNQYTGVLDTLSGGTWTAATAPLGDPLSAATCTTDACVAVGTYGYDAGLIDNNAPGAWTATTVQPPANASTADGVVELGWLACPSTGHCVAVGPYTDNSGQPQSMIAVQGS